MQKLKGTLTEGHFPNGTCWTSDIQYLSILLNIHIPPPLPNYTTSNSRKCHFQVTFCLIILLYARAGQYIRIVIGI